MSTTQPDFGTQSDSSTTDTAKHEARRIADVASSEAQNVAQEARAHAQGLLDDARTQVDEQSRTQLGKLTDLLARLGDDLEQMAETSDRDGLAKDVTRAVSDRAHELRSRIDGREPKDLLNEVRDFARRRPGTFLFGALAAGVVAGRFARGAKDGSSSAGAGSSGSVEPGPLAVTDLTGAQHADTVAGDPLSSDPLDSPLGAAPTVAGTGVGGDATPPHGDPLTDPGDWGRTPAQGDPS
jgi:hypothetical protein